MKEKRKLRHILNLKRDTMIGHLLRHNNLTKSVIEVDIERGRPMMEYIKQIMIHTDKDNYNYNFKGIKLQKRRMENYSKPIKQLKT